jgi:hypothetical protein
MSDVYVPFRVGRVQKPQTGPAGDKGDKGDKLLRGRELSPLSPLSPTLPKSKSRTRDETAQAGHGCAAAATRSQTRAAPISVARDAGDKGVKDDAATGVDLPFVAALRSARAADIKLEVVGEELAIYAPFGAPPAVIDALRAHRAEITQMLIPGPGGHTPEDWFIEWEERAAILEHDQGLPRPEAEALAFDIVLAKYLDVTPPTAVRGVCAHCRCGDLPDNPLIPHGGSEGTPGWPVPLHTSCFQSWHSRRRAEAAATLKSWGLGTDNPNYAP